MLLRTLLLAAIGLRCVAQCGPATDLEAEFQKAAGLAARVVNPFGAIEKAEPFRAVRDRHPADLFAHERYQDAMNEYGIEGHLRLLNKEYLELDFKHPGEAMYHYLYVRTLAGRHTPAAIQGLNELAAQNPDFAPAHQTLAEIYATETFRDAAKEKLERERYGAICPEGKFRHWLSPWPPPIPVRSPLIQEAERALADGADPERVIALTIQGLQELEWRSQRIRAFDWFTPDAKIADARELREHYWEAWAIEVKSYRKAGDAEKASELLRRMESRAALVKNRPGPEYRTAAEVLASLE